MAVLSETDRARACAHWIRINPGVASVTKAQLRAGFDVTDDHIEGIQAAYNAALPAAVRNGCSLEQKTLMFCLVAMRRAGILKTLEDGN